MAPGQRLSPECERDSAGADRAKFHAPLLSFEKSMRTTPARPARPTCAGASVIRDGTEGSATSNSAGFCAGCGESDIGSAVVGWLSQPPAHRHAFERQRSGWKQTDVAYLSAEHPDELAEVAPLQHSDESAWRVFETVDDVLAVANASRGDARTNLAQEAHRKHKRSVGRATPASWVWSSRPIPA